MCVLTIIVVSSLGAILAYLFTQARSKLLEGKLGHVERLAKKVEELSSNLPPKEKDVLRRQVAALKNDFVSKINQLDNDRKTVEDFYGKLQDMQSKIAEFEDKLRLNDGENNAEFRKVGSLCKV